MSRRTLIILVSVLAVILAAELGFVAVMSLRPDTGDGTMSHHETTDPSTGGSQSTDSDEPSVTTEPDAPTEPTTEETEPTEPEPERFMLTFVGDCTLASSPTQYSNSKGFIKTIGENYDYPFEKVVHLFEDDDFTMINLECVLMDKPGNSSRTFPFRGPTAYTNIMTGSSVEAVTLANNHAADFGNTGYNSTTTALQEAGLPYVENYGTMIYTTDSGLTIGVYAAFFYMDEDDMRKDIGALKEAGVDIIVAALHWGNEGKYRPLDSQVYYGKVAIDAGASIVYGHHPHVLQKIEEYNGGIIYYSLGNFCFGGNHNPRDKDSVIVRQEVVREPDGTVHLGELKLIPVSISGIKNGNNFQPVILEEGTEQYDRVLSKLNGTFTGPDLTIDYSEFEKPDEPTQPSEPTEPGGDTGTGDDTGTGGESGGDTGTGGDTGSGGDSGSSGGDSGSGGESGGSDPAPTPTPDPAPTPTPDPAPDAGSGGEG